MKFYPFYRRKKFLINLSEVTVSDFLAKVVIPGIVTLYLIYTEKDFIAAFNNEARIVFIGEIIFMGLHGIFTYFLLPAMWVMDIVKYFEKNNDVANVLWIFTHFVGSAFFWVLLILISIRIFFPI